MRGSSIFTRIIQFARGDRFKKYAPDSAYNTDPNAREIRDAVISKNPEAMIRADIKVNLSGKHTAHREEISKMETGHRDRQGYLNAQGLHAQAKKEDVAHRKAVAQKESDYATSFLGKKPTIPITSPSGATSDKELKRINRVVNTRAPRKKLAKSEVQSAKTSIGTFGKSMAGELKENADILRSVRTTTGVKPSAGVNERLTEVLPGLRKKVQKEVGRVMSSDPERAAKLRETVTGMARERIHKASRAALTPEVLEGRVGEVTKQIFKPGAIGAKESATYDLPSTATKLKMSPRAVEHYHRVHSRLVGAREPFVAGARDWKAERVSSVTRQVLKKGKVFEPLASAVHATPGQYPILKRNIGKLAGAAAIGGLGIAAAGAYIHKKLRRNNETQMSSHSHLIAFATGDSFRRLLHHAAQMGIKSGGEARTKIIQERLGAASKGIRKELLDRYTGGDITEDAYRTIRGRVGRTRRRVARNMKILRGTGVAKQLLSGDEKLHEANQRIGELTDLTDTLQKTAKSQAAKHGVETRRIRTEAGETQEATKGQHSEEVGKLRQDVRKVRMIGYRNTKSALKIGAGAGLAIGGGAGYVAGKKRNQETNFSAIRNLLGHRNQPAGVSAHDVATGGIEGGLGVLATDPLIHRIQTGQWKTPFSGGPRKTLKNIGIGAGVGAVATGLVGYVINKAAQGRKKQPVQTELSAINLDISRIGTVTHDRVFADGSHIDIKKLIKLVKDRKPRKVAIASLKGISKSKKSGFSEDRLKNARTSLPILINSDREVVDGRHRCIKTKMKGGTHIQAIKVTKKDLKAVQFAALPNRSLVARDRYIKNIHETDQDRAEGTYAKTAVVGGALGALLRNKKTPLGKAVAIGTGLGVGVQALTRHETAKTKDVFGDRPYYAKKIDKAPYAVGGITAAGILAKRLHDQGKKINAGKALRKVGTGILTRVVMAARGQVIQFDDENGKQTQRYLRKLARNPEARAEETFRHIGRAQRLVHDINNPNQVDSRGRPKTPEWNKPWVKRAIGVAILAGTVRHGVKSIGHLRATAAAQKALGGEAKGLARVVDSAEGLFRRSPGGRSGLERIIRSNRGVGRPILHAVNEARHVKRDVGDLLNDKAEDVFKRWSGAPKNPAAAKVVATNKQQEAASKIHEKLKGIRETPAGKKPGKLTEYRSVVNRVIRFAETVPDWDLRDARGRSARVYAPGSQRRTRRTKEPWERVNSQKRIREVAAAGTLASGAIGAHLIHKKIEANRIAAEQPDFVEVPGHPGFRESVGKTGHQFTPAVRKAVSAAKRRAGAADPLGKAISDILRKT